MSIHCFFKRQFPLRSRTRGIAFLCFILLMYGCGGEESVDKPMAESVGDEKPINDVPISIPYYPMTVGNRWVYRNPDGSEWTREVIDAREIGGVLYHFFDYNPPTENGRLDFLHPTAYAGTHHRLVGLVKASKIDPTFWDIITESNEGGGGYGVRGNEFGYEIYKNGDGFVALENYITEVTWHSDWVPLRYPITPDSTYDALEIKLEGALEFISIFHSYEVQWSISGHVGSLQTIVTPAGKFNDCVGIYYDANVTPVTTKEIAVGKNHDTKKVPQLLSVLESDLNEELKDLFMLVKPKLGFENMWLAPGVGPVKIETPNGIAELIDYEVKAVASDR